MRPQRLIRADFDALTHALMVCDFLACMEGGPSGSNVPDRAAAALREILGRIHFEESNPPGAEWVYEGSVPGQGGECQSSPAIE